MNNENNNTTNNIPSGQVNNGVTNQGTTPVNNNPSFTVMLDKPVTPDAPKVPETPTPVNIPSTPVNNVGVTPNPVVTPVTPAPVNSIPEAPSVDAIPPVGPEPVSNTAPVNATPVEPAPINQNPTPVNTPTNNPVNQVSYTNPQTIGAMPGFDSSSVVGTTPPISLEGEKKPKKGGNKILFIILIIVLLAAIGGGVYFLLSSNILSGGNKTKIEVNDFEANLGEELPAEMEKYAKITGTNSTNCERDISAVNINKEGTYEFVITCGSMKRKGKITIVDNRPIEVTPVTVYKVVGEQAEAKDFAISDYDNITYEFADPNEVTSKLSTPGVHDIAIKASNSSGKTSDFTSKLVVTQYNIKARYNCVINTSEISNPTASKTVSYRFMISDAPNEINVYGGLTQEITKYIITSIDDYNSLKNKFNEEKTITIDGITANYGDVTFDDNEHSITLVSKIFDNSELYTTYGEDNIKDYLSIVKYFGAEGLGYTCTVQ